MTEIGTEVVDRGPHAAPDGHALADRLGIRLEKRHVSKASSSSPVSMI